MIFNIYLWISIASQNCWGIL